MIDNLVDQHEENRPGSEINSDDRNQDFGVSRRGFLKAAGFTLAGAMLTACEPAPVQKAIPYLLQPEEIIPGKAYHYATTCTACPAGCGLLAKNRDGRPIKLEGIPDHPISKGGLCAVGQASILGLYDSHRLKHPLQDGKESTWTKADDAIIGRLEVVRQQGGAVRVLTGRMTSPTKRAVIDRFLQSFPDGRHVTYETLSSSAIVDAHQRTHGAGVLPRYLFDKAEVIVSFDADFLGTWISPVEFTAGYRAGRALDGESIRFSHHTQFESRYSITGGKADQRVRIAPADVGRILSNLAKRLAPRAGASFDASGIGDAPVSSQILNDVESRLFHARGRSLIVCGVQDIRIQVLCNFLNHILGNYGSTLDVARPSYQRGENDAGFQALLQEMDSGIVQVLLIDGINPVYSHPHGSFVGQVIRKVPLVVSFAHRLDETSRLAHFVCPDHHALESWADTEAVHGVVGFSQPVIPALGDTRSVMESLSIWNGQRKSAHDLIREQWSGQISWDHAIHDGYAEVSRAAVDVRPFQTSAVEPVGEENRLSPDAFALVLYPKVGMLDGSHAYNPWLHELPDPISKVVWDNYACLSPVAADRLGVSDGDVVRLRVSRSNETPLTVVLPVLVQPGQHDQIVAVALGYGAEETKRFAGIGPRWVHEQPTVGSNGLVGTRVEHLIHSAGETLQYSSYAVTIERTDRIHTLATSQDYNYITVPEHLAPPNAERRPCVQETTLAALTTGSPGHHGHHATLWPDDHEYEGHHWGMAIDLTACTGCSACVVACQIENNVPVVGKDEVRRSRQMHWIRIDRYYEEKDGNVDISHQPMLCHHCDNAPCETVCPVLATVHSDEGLNLQVYNRCVGTRYCSNNCPYKVRRFNWFDYPHGDALRDLVLNPDVTVRSRGIMEKCTFCIQRIQEAKIEAKQHNRTGDGEAKPVQLIVQPACQQSCPASAIAFGDTNNPESTVSRLIKSQRHYRVLEETNIKPSVGYMKLVRNREPSEDQTHHG